MKNGKYELTDTMFITTHGKRFLDELNMNGPVYPPMKVEVGCVLSMVQRGIDIFEWYNNNEEVKITLANIFDVDKRDGFINKSEKMTEDMIESDSEDVLEQSSFNDEIEEQKEFSQEEVQEDSDESKPKKKRKKQDRYNEL